MIHWGRPISGWIIFGMLALVLFCVAICPPGTKPLSPYAMETISSDVEETPLHDSLHYYRYKQVEDSLKAIKFKTDYFSGSTGGGSELLLASLGIGTYGTKENKDQFLIIHGYSLDDYASVDNKKTGSILTYPVWYKVGKDVRHGHLESKAIDLKYKAHDQANEGKVYLPLQEGVGNLIRVVIYILAIITGLLCFYAIFYIPVRLLFQLAKGKAFTEENIGSLYLTGWGLVGLSLLTSFLPIITHLLMQSQIPKEIHFSYYAALLKPWKILVTGLGVLLLAKAFLQGLHLKEEQALTI